MYVRTVSHAAVV